MNKMNSVASQSICSRRAGLLVFITLLLMTAASAILAQDSPNGPARPPDRAHVASVVIDGRLVLQVRGVSSYPASERAHSVRAHILEAARDKSFSVENLKIVQEPDRSSVYAGDKLLLSVFDVDAELESLDRKLLAEVAKGKIASIIVDYRRDRSPQVVLTHVAYALGLTAVMALLFWVILRLFRRLNAWAVHHVHKGAQDLASKSHQLIRAEQVWTLFAGLLSFVRSFFLLILAYFYLNTVLGIFPWTRPAALVLFDLVLNPLRSLWFGFVESLPDLMFLVILFLVVRYILKLIKMFFTQVARGRIKLQNFDQDWALPTHKIVRFLVVAFSLVIAYPYIPGSDSMAFKGVSVFIGVIFSLGSSSFIANVMAGLAMTYRGAFKEGDRIRIDDVFGKVEEIKLMTTRINTLKNESVIIPNSNILNTNVTNYSVMAREAGLVVHTTVGIGYDTSWRQVEALLLLAAERTDGLKKEPAPFVQQTSMGDFAVNYEINAYCTDVARMITIKSDLHRNIQDVFNEYGVQIMSPAYEADPQSPKIVPPEDWYAAPATKPK
jgi:small-conductance mechanosensitive channel